MATELEGEGEKSHQHDSLQAPIPCEDASVDAI